MGAATVIESTGNGRVRRGSGNPKQVRKSQIPSPNFQVNPKPQTQNLVSNASLSALEFEISLGFGTWDLGFAASKRLMRGLRQRFRNRLLFAARAPAPDGFGGKDHARDPDEDEGKQVGAGKWVVVQQ